MTRIVDSLMVLRRRTLCALACQCTEFVQIRVGLSSAGLHSTGFDHVEARCDQFRGGFGQLSRTHRLRGRRDGRHCALHPWGSGRRCPTLAPCAEDVPVRLLLRVWCAGAENWDTFGGRLRPYLRPISPSLGLARPSLGSSRPDLGPSYAAKVPGSSSGVGQSRARRVRVDQILARFGPR